MPVLSAHKIFRGIFFLVMLMPGLVRAQGTDNLRLKSISTRSDTITIDTLSIIPGSVRLTDRQGLPSDPETYRLDYERAWLILIRNAESALNPGDTLVITYRVYPFLFTRELTHKTLREPEKQATGVFNPEVFLYSGKQEDIFNFGGLDKSGSISRGLSFGNNQDVVVNSSLNLRLSGKLSEDIGILAAITDNNIPIQPEGNTQQIQEFDKVYIQLFTKTTRLTAGDFELQKPASYFMQLNKKAQGGMLGSEFSLMNQKTRKDEGKLGVTVAGAVARGQYARNTFNGTEGNQGPYKLKGSNGETYIIILAGSEKVYIDGELMVRGADADYIIDYNLGEITFTPSNLITRDKRIVVEFEYSDRLYARSMYYGALDYRAAKGSVKFHFFSEQDLKNQPVQQELSDENKQLLYAIGDSLWLALVPDIDSLAFSSSEVRYKMIDTLVNAVLYDSVFVYSTSPDSAFYRLGFSNVGEGRGNYVQIRSAANGRVFKWVAPSGGQPSGNYEPVMMLITPKKTQMYTLGGDVLIGKGGKLVTEFALTNRDLNTFSPADKRDDLGTAGRISYTQRIRLGHDSIRGWSMVTAAHYEYIQQYFSPPERYRPVEFDRNWNTAGVEQRADEHLPGIQLGFENGKQQYVRYHFRANLKGSMYQGTMHELDAAYDLRKFFLKVSGSYLNTGGPLFSSRYFKQKASLIKKFKWFSIGFREEQENNRMMQSLVDSLLSSSFAFESYEGFLMSPDSAKTKFSASYQRRYDYLPVLGDMKRITSADDAKASLELGGDPSNLLKMTATWRNLRIFDTTVSQAQRENTLLGRIEFYTRKFRRVITSNTYYEMGSGLEVKKEFSYLEVPAGQGLYSWTDYNGNGIQELDEFEVAAFSDQARYIRVFTPVNEYLRAYYSQFSEALNIEPANAWSSRKGFLKFLSRFVIQMSYRVERKTTDDNLLRAYNPFRSGISDTALLTLNSSLRATLFFNRSNPVFGCEVAWQDNRNKSLLVNGYDARQQQMATARFRWNITRKLMLNGDFNMGEKISTSEYFSQRDYHLGFFDLQPKFSVQTSKTFRLVLMYKYADKNNGRDSLNQRAVLHNAGLEIRLNFLTKGSLQIKGNYLLIQYNADENTPLAYEMLEGFRKGNNATWSLSYQRSLSDNLQLNLIYDGRQSGNNKMVHVGSVQLRAYF